MDDVACYRVTRFVFSPEWNSKKVLGARLMMQEGFHQHKKALGAVESRRLNTLSSDLREFLRKKDYRYAKEAPGKEDVSWLRALRKVSGERFAAPMK